MLASDDKLVDVDPDVIVTFGSDGFTIHRASKALSAWVSTAVRLWKSASAPESQMEPLFEAYGEDFLRSIPSTEVFRPGCVRASVRGCF